MLTFKSIELKDKDIINPYLRQQNYRASDLCFANLYCWGEKFDTQFAVTRSEEHTSELQSQG